MRNKLAVAASLALFACFASRASEPDGGEIVVWPDDPGTFLIINAQKRVSEKVLSRTVSGISNGFSIDVKLVTDKSFDIRTVAAVLQNRGAKGAIWMVDDPALPVSMAAIESGWGVVNVSPIVKDAPDDKVLHTRLNKFVYRVFGALHGVSDPVRMPACVMKQAVGFDGVDAMRCAAVSPESKMKIAAYLKKAGYKTCNVGTYYEACEEGWAPSPTNDVQRQIWNRVHQLPTKPIRILPESQRKKAK